VVTAFKNCIADHLVIDCRICGEQTYSSDLRIKRESNPIKKIFHSFLAELFNDLEKRATHGISKFKGSIFLLILILTKIKLIKIKSY
jgi:hypothetical protein